MTGILSIRSRGATDPSLHRDPGGDASTSPPTGRDDAAAPLPRHLLVSLAGTAADITSLRERFAEEPRLHEPLDRILRKLDDLVDSIYERAADAAARPDDAASRSTSTPHDATPTAAGPTTSSEHRGSMASPRMSDAASP